MATSALSYYPTPGQEYVRVSVSFVRHLLNIRYWDSSPLLHPTYRSDDATMVIPAAWLNQSAPTLGAKP